MAQDLNKSNLYQAASRANLTSSQRNQINALSEMYTTHSRLSGLPINVAQQQYQQLSPEKQNTMAAFFGPTEQPDKPKRSVIEQAAYIVSRPIVEPVKAVFNAANWLSDQTTRIYRTGAIAMAEDKTLSEAWQRSGARGESVFNPNRINRAIQLYGADRVYVAQRVAAGDPLDKIIAEATSDSQKQIAADAAQNKDSLFDETLARVNAAKYSPGRQLANAFLPEDMEGSSKLYTWISGTTDAAFRIGLDPTLFLGKARRGYLAGKYALDKTIGSAENVNEAFNKAGIARFWDEFSQGASELNTARKSKDALGIGEATGKLRRLNPAFVDNGVHDAIIQFANKDFDGVINQRTVKTFLSNVKNTESLFYGQVGYSTKIMPRLTILRKKRLDGYTMVSRKFDLNKDSAEFLRNIAFDEADLTGLTTAEAAQASLMGRAGESAVEAGARTAARLNKADEIFQNKFSLGAINRQFDKFSAKFARIPDAKYLGDFTNERSVRAFGQYARLIYGRYASRILEDMYKAGDLGTRRQMFIGLQSTVGEIRGLRATPGGRKLLDTLGSIGRQATYTNPVFNGKKLFPDVAPYLDGGSGGLVDSRSTVGFVKTEALADMPGNKTGDIELYRKSLREGKGFATREFQGKPFNDPIMVIYNNETGLAFVGEGNHRLKAAIAENIPYVPVRVVRGSAEEMKDKAAQGYAPKQIKNNKTPQFPETVGSMKGTVTNPSYVPPEMHPSYVFDKEFIVDEDFIPDGPMGRIPSRLSSGADSAAYAFQTTDTMNPITIRELDRHGAREGFLGSILGLQYKKGTDDAISAWTAGTLLGPRFPIRNAIEDYLFGIANGASIRSIIRSRRTATKVRTAYEDLNLGLVNKFVRSGKKDEILSELRAIQKDTTLSPIKKDQARRQVVGKVLLDNKFDDAARGEFGNDYDKFLYEFSQYGNFDNLLDEVSEGAKNAALGNDAFSRMSRLQRSKGRVVDYKFNGEEYRRQWNANYIVASPIDSETKIGWAFSINAKANDELGSKGIELLGKYKGDRQGFINEFGDFIGKPEMAKLRSRFDRYQEQNYTPQMHAAVIYDDLFATFSKADGSLNENLLGKIRKVDDQGNIFVDPDGIKAFSDLPTNIEDLPKAITVPKFIPSAQSENYISDFVNRSWDWAGDANARFSRDQLVYDAAFRIRRDLEPMIDHYMRAGMSKEAATRRVVQMSEDLAVERTLAYVDNPAVRSQLAWSMRNFARFYRATEDAYRRFYRTVRYNPEGLRKLSLVYEGVTHSGFVQRDDQGEPYFVYPGVAPVYAALNKALSVFGLGDKFVAPMPLQFGASIKMLTPSADPNSWMPTFSGPLSAIPLKTIFNLAGIAEESTNPIVSRIGKEISAAQKYTSGPVSQNQGFFESILPGHVNRLINSFDKDERNSQYASAFRKAVTYLEAAGYTPSAQATPGEKAQYQRRLQNTIATILTTRFMFGFVAPASPGIQLKSDMAEWARENERTNFKQVWTNLINQYQNTPDPVGRAVQDWVKFFPEQVPYMVNESDPTVQARFKTSDAAAKWAEDNRGLLREYPEGAAFLMPQSGDFTFEAYNALKAQGFRENKLIGDFLEETFVAKAKNYYYSQRDLYEQDLQNATTDRERKIIKERWDLWSTEYKNARPLFQQELADSAANALKRQRAYDDLKSMLEKVDIKSPAAESLRKMVNVYEEYKYYSETIYNSRSQDDVQKRDALRESTLAQLKEISAQNANASSAFDTLFSSFLRD